MLSDFGLVRDADHSLHTATGEFVGTAAYAAPEQLRGEQDAIGPWTDVYAVGVTLYTALAGETPFGAAPAAEMVRRVERGRCRPLRARAPHVPADLEAVIARAMHKRPERRYRSASALLCDLERVLRFEPVEARPVALGSAIGALAARHPVPMLITAALLAAGAFVAGGATARPAPPSRPAPPPVALAAGGALGAAIARAQAAIEVADVRDALRALDEAPAGEREFEWEYLRALCSSSRVLGHFAGKVKTLVVAPNGRQVAVGGYDRAVRIFDVADGALSARIPISDWTRAVAFTPDGSRLLVGTAELEVFDVATGASVVRHRAPGRINALAMRHDGSAIAIGCDSGRVLVFDAAPLLVPRPGVADLPSPSFEGPRHASPIRRVVFGGDWIAAGSSDGAVVMDGSHGAQRHRIPAEGLVDDLAPHPDGRLLAVAAPRGAVIWDVVKGVRLQECEGHRAGAISVAWSGDGRLLASGSIDRTVRMFTSTAADPFATLVGHESDVVAVAFAGATLVSAGERAPDTSIRAWCPEALPLCGLQLRVGDRVVTGLPDPLGRWWACVAPVGTTSSVAIGSLAAPGAPAARLMRSAAGITVAAAPDGAFAAFLGVEGVAIYAGEDLARFARERDAPKPEPVEITQPVGGTATVAAWARGPFIAVGGADGAVVVREVGGSGRQLKGPGGSVQAIACDRGGARVVAALSDRVVFWDFATGREVGGIPEAGVSALAVAPDGGVIATCRPGPKPAVRLWNSADGSLLGALAGHDDAVRCLAFSPGGTRLVSGSDDRAIRVWDWRNRRSVATLREHTGGVYSAAWTLDGRHLLSGSEDGRLVFRRIPPK
jgi:WD40 repeat protein